MAKTSPDRDDRRSKDAKKRRQQRERNGSAEAERAFARRMSPIQDRVQGVQVGEYLLGDVYRHLSTVDIDVHEATVEWTSTFPDQATAHGVGNLDWTRSWEYENAGRLEKLCVRVVRDCERLLRHVDSISIDLDEEEITVETSFPDWSDREEEEDDDEDDEPDDGVRISRTVSLEKKRWSPLREAVRALVAELHERMLQPDAGFEPERCMRCKHSDCCYDWRIHMTEAERQRIVEHLGEPDTAETYAKYFEPDDDLSGYYRTVFKHVGEPAPGKSPEESDGHCSFLKPGPNGRPCCSIYEVRPRVCREFDAGYCTEWTKMLPRRK